MKDLLAAVEAGGTKFRAAVFTRDLKIVEQAWIPTTTPDETIAAVTNFLLPHRPIAAGIASFGPLIVDHYSPDYGSMGATPKPGWTGAPLLRPIANALDVPTEIQTDVEAAAVAEFRMGAGQGLNAVGYVTVGTGIGAALALEGVPFRGRDHTELGHIPVRRVGGDEFEGICPFHGDCLEGMASGPAIAARWAQDPVNLEDRNEVWDVEAAYLAQLVRVYAYSFAPDIILFGGGVGARPDMAPRIQEASIRDLGGYSVSHANNPNLAATAGLGGDAGLFGAALIAASLA